MKTNINSPADVQEFKSFVDSEINKLEDFFNEAEKNEPDESTLFTIESKSGASTWYVDFKRSSHKYSVCKDEHFICCRNTLGEALEFIFERIGSTKLKLL